MNNTHFSEDLVEAANVDYSNNFALPKEANVLPKDKIKKKCTKKNKILISSIALTFLIVIGTVTTIMLNKKVQERQIQAQMVKLTDENFTDYFDARYNLSNATVFGNTAMATFSWIIQPKTKAIGESMASKHSTEVVQITLVVLVRTSNGKITETILNSNITKTNNYSITKSSVITFPDYGTTFNYVAGYQDIDGEVFIDKKLNLG